VDFFATIYNALALNSIAILRWWRDTIRRKAVSLLYLLDQVLSTRQGRHDQIMHMCATSNICTYQPMFGSSP
jgi:hypothetical protein